MLTVHVGGGRTSSPRVMEYYNEFKKQNALLPEIDRIKVGASFSYVSSNTSYQVETNENLETIIKDYNEMFKTNHNISEVKEYVDDLSTRVNKTASDRKYLDLLIVIDQFLTGFDAPELNTLYIDRTFKGSGLIQAYSRTNRVHDRDNKPHGNIVNFRWPVQNELEMNKAFAIYSDRNSAVEQLTLEELIEINQTGGLLAKPYNELIDEFKELIHEIKILTDKVTVIPKSEKEREELYVKLMQYNGILNKLKQYPYDEKTLLGYPKDDKNKFYDEIGITKEEEVYLTTAITYELRELIAKKENIDISQVSLFLEHIQEVLINYDYLIDLIAKMADYINDGLESKAIDLVKELEIEVAKIKSDKEKRRFLEFARKIISGEFKFSAYPTTRDYNEVINAMEDSEHDANKKDIEDFIEKFGVGEVTNYRDLYRVISKHKVGKQDLDKRKEITYLMNESRDTYGTLAVEEVSKLNWINYRKEFQKEVHKLADRVKENE